MKKVLLLSMPYGALERQALGLSLLKAHLAEAEIPCDVKYFTFTFAGLIGHDAYEWISGDLPYTAFAGDWTFTHALYGDRPDADQGYIQEILRETWHLDETAIQHVLRIRSYTGHFLDYCMAAVPWHEYAVVGFTSTFEQNVASLALAQRIKAAHPDIAIVFGGANWEGAMGLALHRCFPFVDYAFSGEADESFPAFAARYLADDAFDPSADPTPGMVYRHGSGSVSTGPATLIREVDALPYPDYSDYFSDLSESTVAASVVPIMLFETSRGCWWGAKSHCTFCGLNGGAMTFRSKHADRALAELTHLVDRWQIEYVEVIDNILDMKYFNDFLPALAEREQPLYLFYEVKANLNRKHIELLHRAGVKRIQPGIESMSNHVLALMRKGTTALRNIQLLKWCKAYGVAADWNILYGFPGETQADYDAMLTLLPAIRFLDPPTACGPVRLDRFSPYHNDPAAFGLHNIRPMAPYKYLYPFDDASLAQIAYYFEYDYDDGVDPRGVADKVIAYVEAWKRNPEPGTLVAAGSSDRLTLFDTRSDATQPQYVLSGMEKAAYEYCDQMRAGPRVIRHLRQRFPEVAFTDEQVYDFLDALVAHRLMAKDETHYLSLAILKSTVQPPATRRAAAVAVS